MQHLGVLANCYTDKIYSVSRNTDTGMYQTQPGSYTGVYIPNVAVWDTMQEIESYFANHVFIPDVTSLVGVNIWQLISGHRRKLTTGRYTQNDMTGNSHYRIVDISVGTRTKWHCIFELSEQETIIRMEICVIRNEEVIAGNHALYNCLQTCRFIPDQVQN